MCTCPINAASSTRRCDTIQCIDLIMLPREIYLFGFTTTKPSQGSVPAGVTLASDFGFCFQFQKGSSLVLRRPIEITAVTGHYLSKIRDRLREYSGAEVGERTLVPGKGARLGEARFETWLTQPAAKAAAATHQRLCQFEAG